MEALKEKYKNALSNPYSVDKVIEGSQIRPGIKPEHVFDFENGIRLIISRDYHGGKEYIHISGSYDEKTYKGKVGAPLLARMRMSYWEVSGKTFEFPKPIYSKGGIPHWLIEHTNQN